MHVIDLATVLAVASLVRVTSEFEPPKVTAVFKDVSIVRPDELRIFVGDILKLLLF